MNDWNSNEASNEFDFLQLLKKENNYSTIELEYSRLRLKWQNVTMEMQRLEVVNNRIFIEAYGLQDELTPDVPIHEITLTCNPWYRYGKKCENQKPGEFPVDEELEARLREDTMKELMSYAVGCMFGRYSLDKPGLILANQGETLEDYLKQVPEPSFEPDDDNVIPILDEGWFSDDITERFKQFLKVTYGTEHYEENLKFIEAAIGKDIRKFFLKDFYDFHVKMYKKRPIYWLFSSPKGSFNALIYMHRYTPDLVSIVLNNYLREYKVKLNAKFENMQHLEASPDSSSKDKIMAQKEIVKIKKIIKELDEYERDVLFPLASKKIEIDLDDGVKVNYPKFGKALAKISGLDRSNDE